MKRTRGWLLRLFLTLALAISLVPLLGTPGTAQAGPLLAVDAALRTTDSAGTTTSFYKQGATAYLELKDADLDVATSVAEGSLSTPVTYTIASGNHCVTGVSTCTEGAGALSTISLARGPLEDTNGDGFITTADVVVSTGEVTVAELVANPTDSTKKSLSIKVRRTNTGATTAITGFSLNYKGNPQRTPKVKVSTTANPTGIDVTLSETLTSSTASSTNPYPSTYTTGTFTGSVVLDSSATDAAASPPKIQTLTQDVMTVSYSDTTPLTGTTAKTVQASATVETTAPTVTNGSPTHKKTTNVTTQTLSADVTDAQSGVKSDGITIKWGLDDGTGGSCTQSTDRTASGYCKASDTILQEGEVDGSNTSPALTIITNGFNGSTTVSSLSEGTYVWYVSGTDKAGNTGRSSADALTADTTVSGVTYPAGTKLDYRFKIDTTAPSISSGSTGEYVDTSLTDDSATSGSDTSNDERFKKNSTSWVRVLFSEALDSATVSASDFTVTRTNADGTTTTFTVVDAKVYSSTSTTAANSVFLQLTPALNPNDSVTVTLAGSVSDKAGNAIATGTASVSDKIAPTLSVAVLDSAGAVITKTNSKAVIQISSNESLVEAPKVTIYDLNADSLVTLTTMAAKTSGTTTTKVVDAASATQKATTLWEYTYTVTASEQRVLDVVVSGKDLLVNTGSKGSTDLSKTVITFLADQKAPAAASATTPSPDAVTDFLTISPAGVAGVIQSPNPFLTLNFTEAVTVVSATLDGGSITLQQNPDKAWQYRYGARGLGDGDHTLKIQVKDTAGNTSPDLTATTVLTSTFKTGARPKFSLALDTGWNIVSLPDVPVDGSLTNLLRDVTDVAVIYSYDPKGTPRWTFARYDSTAKTWSGTLTSMMEGKGYYMFANAPVTVKVDIIDRQSETYVIYALPQFTLSLGWNLVSYPALNWDATDAATADPDDIFLSISGKWSTAYLWSPASGWTVIKPKATTVNKDIKIGQGLWVYVTADGLQWAP